MNRTQLTLALVVGLLVGGIAAFLYQRNNQSWRLASGTPGERLLPNFPLNDITHIRIQNASNALHLVKTDETWRVRERYDYPAAFSEISDFLRKIWELKPVQTTPVGPSQLARLELLNPAQGPTNGAGTLVEFKTKDGKDAGQLLLGKKHMRQSSGASPFGDDGWPDGRFLMTPGAKEAAIIRDPLSNIEPKPESWLGKDFFKVEKLKSVAVTHTNPAASWKLFREQENGEIKLADPQEGETLDTGKSSSAGWLLSSPSFVDVANPQATPAETGLDQPVTATLETFDGFTYTVKVGGKSGEDNHYLAFTVSANLAPERSAGPDEKPEDKERLDKEFKDKRSKLEDKLKLEKSFEKWTYITARWTVETLLKQRKDFLMDKAPETPAAASPSAEVPPTPPVTLPTGLETPDHDHEHPE